VTEQEWAGNSLSLGEVYNSELRGLAGMELFLSKYYL
jgi:hypothetical protein